MASYGQGSTSSTQQKNGEARRTTGDQIFSTLLEDGGEVINDPSAKAS